MFPSGTKFPGRVLCVLLISASLSVQAQWHRADDAIMGTTIHVEVWSEDRNEGESLTRHILDEMRRIDNRMSPYKESSELSQLNRRASEAPVRISAELLELIQRALLLSRSTGGAFDITFAGAGHAYDYRTAQRPGDKRLKELKKSINYRNVKVDDVHSTIFYSGKGVRIDLGGIAKGYAVERSIQFLQRKGIRHALVSAGGDTRVLGDRRGRPWLVGVRHPRSDEKLVTRIPLVNEAVSTSGDYERFFEEDGVRYHHILNPETGDSAREVQSVTVIGPDATMTDGLSTSVFVLGTERGLALINGIDDYETIIVDNKGKLHYSQGLVSR